MGSIVWTVVALGPERPQLHRISTHGMGLRRPPPGTGLVYLTPREIWFSGPESDRRPVERISEGEDAGLAALVTSFRPSHGGADNDIMFTRGRGVHVGCLRARAGQGGGLWARIGRAGGGLKPRLTGGRRRSRPSPPSSPARGSATSSSPARRRRRRCARACRASSSRDRCGPSRRPARRPSQASCP